MNETIFFHDLSPVYPVEAYASSTCKRTIFEILNAEDGMIHLYQR